MKMSESEETLQLKRAKLSLWNIFSSLLTLRQLSFSEILGLKIQTRPLLIKHTLIWKHFQNRNLNFGWSEVQNSLSCCENGVKGFKEGFLDMFFFYHSVNQKTLKVFNEKDPNLHRFPEIKQTPVCVFLTFFSHSSDKRPEAN